MHARLPRFLAFWGTLLPLWSAGQSIEPVTQSLRLGESLRIELRVRGFEIDPARLQADCLSAQVSQGGEPLPERALTIHTTPLADDGHVLVRLSSATLVHEPLVHVRARVHCGADYAREFSLLADPPAGQRPPDSTPARAQRPQAPHPAMTATPRATSGAHRAPSPPATTLATAPSAQDVERLAQAVARLLWQRLPSAQDSPDRPSPAAAPVPDEPWQRELNRLRDEQRDAHTRLAGLQYKLDQTQDTDRLRWLLMATLTALLLGAAALRRWWTERRLGQIDSRLEDLPHRAHAQAATGSGPAPAPHRLRERWQQLRRPRAAAHTPGPTSDLTAALVDTPVSMPAAPGALAEEPWLAFELDTGEGPAADPATDLTAERSRRWEHTDFGLPTLDPPAHPQWLQQVDALAQAGYHGAALAVFENALHQMPAKPAWLLLRLLDLYAALDQSANHERVAAELEALYSIRIPALHAPDTEDALLEQRSDLMAQVCTLWREPAAAARLLESWLLPDPDHARLGLAAFRDTLLLHGLARELAASATSPEPVTA